MELLTLSPSTLSLYVECPRCFWRKVVKKIDRPRGPMPTIMSGLDLVIKAYYDQFRRKGDLPPMVADKLPGKLASTVPPWLTLGDPATNTKLVGKLDELLEPEPGKVAPLDHKSRGKKAEEVHRAYQLQMDVYDLLLEAAGFSTPHKAYLVYYIPDVMNAQEITFAIDVKELTTDPNRARSVFANAANVARGPEPQPNTECEFCRYLANQNQPPAPAPPDIPF
jgi:hypothetical protein